MRRRLSNTYGALPSPDTTNPSSSPAINPPQQQASSNQQSHQTKEQPEQSIAQRKSTRLVVQRTSAPNTSVQQAKTGSKRKSKKSTGKSSKVNKKVVVQDDESSEEDMEVDVYEILKDMNKDDLQSMMDRLNVQVIFNSPTNNNTENQDPCDEFIEADAKFNDQMPTTLPHGCQVPVRYNGPLNPSWCKFSNIIPSRWPNHNPIIHPKPWLQTIHLRHEHRASVIINNNDILRWNHHIVFYRAAKNWLEANPSQEFDSSLDVEHSISRRSWARAIKHDEVAPTYFFEKNKAMNKNGYCILERFVADHEIPSTVSGTQLVPDFIDKHLFSKLRDFYNSTFPKAEERKDPKSRTIWDTIINSGGDKDEQDNLKGTGRFTSTHYGVTKALESNDRVWVCKAKALYDVRIASAISALNLVNNNENDLDSLMYSPKTGGRWLMTTENCKRQQLHTDFPSLSAMDLFNDEKCPGYFTITTGEKSVPVWVSPRSHRIVALGSTVNPSKSCDVELISIPPFSIMVGRGDLFHAGAAYEDSTLKSHLLRYHMYFIPNNYSLPDGVFLAHTFKPNFLESNITDEEESMDIEMSEDPVLNSSNNQDINITQQQNPIISSNEQASSSQPLSLRLRLRAPSSEPAPIIASTPDALDNCEPNTGSDSLTLELLFKD